MPWATTRTSFCRFRQPATRTARTVGTNWTGPRALASRSRCQLHRTRIPTSCDRVQKQFRLAKSNWPQSSILRVRDTQPSSSSAWLRQPPLACQYCHLRLHGSAGINGERQGCCVHVARQLRNDYEVVASKGIVVSFKSSARSLDYLLGSFAALRPASLSMPFKPFANTIPESGILAFARSFPT